jgi:hypothetical protein
MRVMKKPGGLNRGPVLAAILFGWTILLALTAHSSPPASATTSSIAVAGPYGHALSSGTFALPTGAKSVDWIVLNDSPNPQQIRVTVYKVLIGTPKTVVPPGPITSTVAPNSATHNANSVGSVFNIGGTYEVVVETNDARVLPSVDVWSTAGAVIIPGTHLSPRDFSEVK